VGRPGCWCGDRKIGAIGVRIEHGVSYHGVALNVSVRLVDFELIEACGMPEVESTSIDRELGRIGTPTTESVREAAEVFAWALAGEFGSRLGGRLALDPQPSRQLVERLLAPAAVLAGAG
jgi:lipoyl(octanoyl) transferase